MAIWIIPNLSIREKIVTACNLLLFVYIQSDFINFSCTQQDFFFFFNLETLLEVRCFFNRN